MYLIIIPLAIISIIIVIFYVYKNYIKTQVKNTIDTCNAISVCIDGENYFSYIKNIAGKKFRCDTNNSNYPNDYKILKFFNGGFTCGSGYGSTVFFYVNKGNESVTDITASEPPKNALHNKYLSLNIKYIKEFGFGYFYEETKSVLFHYKFADTATEIFRIIKTIIYLTQQQKQSDNEQIKKDFHNQLNALKNIEVVSIPCEVKRNNLENMPHIALSRYNQTLSTNPIISFTIVDIQTTQDKIIEIAAIKFIESKPIDKFLIKTKIEQDNNLGIPTIDEIKKSFISFIGNTIIVNYNLFEILKFLYQYGFDKIFNSRRKYYDISQCCISYQKTILKCDNPKAVCLSTACKHFNVFYEKGNTLSECLSMGILFCKLLDKVQNNS